MSVRDRNPLVCLVMVSPNQQTETLEFKVCNIYYRVGILYGKAMGTIRPNPLSSMIEFYAEYGVSGGYDRCIFSAIERGDYMDETLRCLKKIQELQEEGWTIESVTEIDKTGKYGRDQLAPATILNTKEKNNHQIMIWPASVK